MQTYVLAFQNNEYQRQFFLISESGHEFKWFPTKKKQAKFFLTNLPSSSPIYRSHICWREQKKNDVTRCFNLSAKSCISEYWKKGNIEQKGISWAGLAGRCLASRWYSLLFNIHLFSIFTYTWFGTKFVDVDEKAAICYLGLSQLKLNLSGFKKKGFNYMILYTYL